MKHHRQRRAQSPVGRRWHLVPPLIHGADPLEGATVLQEIGGESGLLLWQALRDVLLWATTPLERRRELFGSRAGRARAEAIERSGTPPELGEPLAVLAGLLLEPANTGGEEVAAAMQRIARWAEQRGSLGSALLFAQNAALAAPKDAGAAYEVARIARSLADHSRAEVWYRRAIGLARRDQDWRLYARAFRGLGNLSLRRGNLPGARRLHTRSLRGARRGGLRQERAAALHDLFVVSAEMGENGAAQRYASEAFSAYGENSPRIAVLAHDVAYHWMETGYFSRALPVFESVLPLLSCGSERLLVLSDVSRAAAGAGESDRALAAADEVSRLAPLPDLRDVSGRALLEVSRGALLLQEWERAEAAAAQSVAYAADRQEAKTLFAAESVLEAARLRQRISVPVALEPAKLGAPGQDGEALAAQMVSTLRAQAAAAR